MRSFHTSASASATRTLVGAVGVSPACLSPGGELSRVWLPDVSPSRVYLPGSLRSPGVTRFHRYYGPLTPARLSPPRRYLHFPMLPSGRSRSNRTPADACPVLAVLGPSRVRRSHGRLRPSLAGSPNCHAVSSSLSFGTNLPPRAALHPVLRRRSCLRLPRVLCLRQGDDFPFLSCWFHGRTRAGGPPASPFVSGLFPTPTVLPQVPSRWSSVTGHRSLRRRPFGHSSNRRRRCFPSPTARVSLPPPWPMHR